MKTKPISDCIENLAAGWKKKSCQDFSFTPTIVYGLFYFANKCIHCTVVEFVWLEVTKCFKSNVRRVEWAIEHNIKRCVLCSAHLRVKFIASDENHQPCVVKRLRKLSNWYLLSWTTCNNSLMLYNTTLTFRLVSSFEETARYNAHQINNA